MLIGEIVIRKVNLVVNMKKAVIRQVSPLFLLQPEKSKIWQIVYFRYQCVHFHMCHSPAYVLVEVNCGRLRWSEVDHAAVMIGILRIYYY